jgi:hypothetical protein
MEAMVTQHGIGILEQPAMLPGHVSMLQLDEYISLLSKPEFHMSLVHSAHLEGMHGS